MAILRTLWSLVRVAFKLGLNRELIHHGAFGTSVSRHLGIVVLNTSPGGTFFIRLGHEQGFLISHTVFRRAEPDVAKLGNPQVPPLGPAYP